MLRSANAVRPYLVAGVFVVRSSDTVAATFFPELMLLLRPYVSLPWPYLSVDLSDESIPVNELTVND
jgi:hypothetical protein